MSSEKEKLLQQMAELAGRIKQSKAKLLNSAKLALEQPNCGLPSRTGQSPTSSVSISSTSPISGASGASPMSVASPIPNALLISASTKADESEFALNYDRIGELPKLPCDKWPHCTHGTACRKQHPSIADLLRPPGPLRLEDILPLIIPFKNSTVALEKLHFMLNARIHYRTRLNELIERGLASNIPAEKARQLAEQVLTAQLQNASPTPYVLTQDQVLQAMGLEDSSRLAMALASSTKVTSERSWSAEHGCYFAVMRHDKAFLVRYYQLNSRPLPTSSELEKEQDFTIVIEAKERRNLHNAVLPKNVIHDQEGCTIVVEPKKKRIKEPEQEFVAVSGFKTLNGAPIHQENKGFHLLEKLGWKRGTGLGKHNHGQQAPVTVPFFVGRAGLTGECDDHVDSSYLDSTTPAQLDLCSAAALEIPCAPSSSASDAFDSSDLISSSITSSISTLLADLSSELLQSRPVEIKESVEPPLKKAKEHDDFHLFMKEPIPEPSAVKDFDLYSGLD